MVGQKVDRSGGIPERWDGQISPHGCVALVESGDRGWDGLRQGGMVREDATLRMEKGGQRGLRQWWGRKGGGQR